MKQQDKRVRRTNRALAEALIGLTLEQGYESVTIQEITERAGVGYRTYFRHYPDKDALLGDVLQSTVAELRTMVGDPGAFAAGDYRPLPPENGRIIFEHVAAHPDRYRVLFSSGSVALEPLMAYGQREALSALERVPNLPLPPSILAQHMVSTIFAQVRWWLENDMPYSPQEMAIYLAQLTAVPAV